MAFLDIRDNPCSGSVAGARDRLDIALWRMMSFYETPLADLDLAHQADPGWIMPPLMKAGFLLSLTEPGLLPEAQAQLDAARPRLQQATRRERLHFEALQAILAGRWQAAGQTWDDILLDYPRDALALHWAHLWDFYRGDAHALRHRPARALPEWDPNDRLYPQVLAQWAFGLEENNLYQQAEEVARRALATDPRCPWAVHAVAHVMEMQGRFEDGAAWLRQHQPVWVEGNGFAVHLWWHKALFRLEAMDCQGVLRLIDSHISGQALQITLNRVDAASILWRLHLLGEDISSASAALLRDWPLDDEHAGHYAFNDVHVVLALLTAGQASRAESWLARCAERALKPSDASRTNHLVAREVALPLMRGLLAWTRGDADGAADLMAPVRAQAARMGGSHAQRDLIDQTLMAVAAEGSRRALGRALLNERVMAKPVTPLTRHWMQRLDQPNTERA